MTLRSFSYGAGTQSTAALVLAARGEIDFPLFMFSNVGADSEKPGTIEYVHTVAAPYAAAHGIELVEVSRVEGKGEHTGESLLEHMVRLEKGYPIPMRLAPAGIPSKRVCTHKFKIDVIARELERRGASKTDPAWVGLGITTDEIERARSEFDPRNPTQRRCYPLLDLRLHRSDCERIIAEAGLPQPGKSCCWFCPFHRTEDWRKMRRDTPELFEKACGVEELLQERRKKQQAEDPSRGTVYLTSAGATRGKTLRELLADDEQMTFDDELSDACDGGYCMT
jgi:hypothetical protein